MSKIYHLNELEEFLGADDWELQIDVTDLWNQYNDKKITLIDFNKKYYNRLLEYKKDINNMGDDVWTDLESILKKMIDKDNEKELLPVYESIYDWADKNDILIKTK